jgi:hypothetical protein
MTSRSLFSFRQAIAVAASAVGRSSPAIDGRACGLSSTCPAFASPGDRTEGGASCCVSLAKVLPPERSHSLATAGSGAASGGEPSRRDSGLAPPICADRAPHEEPAVCSHKEGSPRLPPLSHGRVPILYADAAKVPLEGRIRWEDFTVRVPEDSGGSRRTSSSAFWADHDLVSASRLARETWLEHFLPHRGCGSSSLPPCTTRGGLGTTIEKIFQKLNSVVAVLF